MTIEELKQVVSERLAEYSVSLVASEDNGYDEYDYLQGLVESYEVFTEMLNKLTMEGN
jgi:hypothetical protein